ncbi:MAG: hypothetical protein KME31_08445 [Tolypothrix carrinoi HA7290-LM1]|jgi:hypothetical protein|nr:hypothetical protein [Tolypothrix carrinoi HA7290-LM1]
MADFPTFGAANRAAPLFQKEIFPNIQLETNVSSPPSSPKTVVVRISIVNLKTDLVASTLDRLFAYTLESANNELTTSSVPVTSTEAANIHFEIDVARATSQGYIAGSTPGSVSTPTYTTVKTANIDILIENLQVTLLVSTLQRIKAYMSAAVSADLNP